MTTSPTRYWVNTISLEHVLLGVEGGFTQADPSRRSQSDLLSVSTGQTRLRRLQRGDGIAFYSPRTAIRTGKPLQRFTALGVVDDDEPYRVELRPDVHPWRRRVVFEEVASVRAKPLLPVLGFVDDEEHWGLPFRRGLFEVPAGDFGAIAGAMRDAVLFGDESGPVIGSDSA